MKRNHWQHVMAGLIFLAANLQAWAGAELNLLGNPELAKDAQGQMKSWNASPAEAWTRAAIESFKGLPFTVNYMRFEGKKGELVQSGVAVETNTWYVLRAWFRADLKDDGYARFYALPDKADPAAKRYNQITQYGEDVCDVEDATLAPFGGIKLGSVSDWVEIRAYAFSGVSTQLTLRAEVQGPGECCLGNPEVVKLPDDEFLNPHVVDGNFSKGVVGREPAMFSVKPAMKVPVRVGKCAGMTQDSQNCLCIDRKTQAAAYIYGPQSILVRPGETLEVSLWAKTYWRQEELETPLILTVFSLRQGKWWRSAQAVMLTRNWERVVYRVTIPEQGGSYIPGPQLLDVHLQATGGIESVLISDFKLRILTAGQSGTVAEEYWWKPQGGNHVMNGSFEAGIKGWCAWFYTWDVDSASKSLGEITIDETAAAQGRCSLKVAIPDYPAGSPTTHVISASFKIPSKEIIARVESACFEVDPKMDYTVSFWAKTDVPGNATVSAGGQKFILTNQWMRYTATYNPDKPTANLLYPTFVFQGTGSHYLDGVMIETGQVVSSFEPAEPADVGGRFLRRYPLFARGEKPEAWLFINNSGKEKTSYRLDRTIRDWQGKQVMKNEQDVNLGANETKIETVPLFGQAYGVFSARFELLDSATRQRINWFEMNYGVLPEQDGKLTAAESPVGVIPFLIHFWTGYNVPGGSLDEFNDVLQRIGCRWIGIYSQANWRNVERKPGDWVWSDAYMQSFKKHGFEMYAILGGKMQSVPEWAFSDEPVLTGGKQEVYRGIKVCYPKMEAWNEYVRQFVGHYKGMIGYYEVLGETGGATPDWFMRINKATQPIIREVDPGAKMLGPCYPCHALPWGDEDDTWVGQVFKKGIYDYVDIVTAHFYPPLERGTKGLEESMSARGTEEQQLAQRISCLRSKYGDKPLWNTEYGLFNVSKYPWFYSQHTKAKLRGFREGDLYSTDRKHAERWVRWNVMLLAAGVERSMQHTFGHPGLNMQSYQAMLHPDYSPKMAIGSCAQMCRRLVAPKLRKQKAVERTRVMLFDTRNGPVILFWDFGLEDKAGRLEVSGIAPRDMDLEDLMGNPLEPETASGDMLRLPLSPAPAYLVPKKAEDAERLFEALSQGKRVVLEGGSM